MAVLGESITFKNPIWDLKWAAVWEGGIGREDCTANPPNTATFSGIGSIT